MCEKCTTASPPPYLDARMQKKPKGPFKRLLNGVKALFCGMGRSSGSEYDKELYQVTLRALQAELRRDEVEEAANEAWLKSQYASIDFLRLEHKSAMSLYKFDEKRANADATLKEVYETWLASLDAKIKREEARIEHGQREQDVLDVSKGFLEAAIRSSLLKLKGKL